MHSSTPYLKSFLTNSGRLSGVVLGLLVPLFTFALLLLGEAKASAANYTLTASDTGSPGSFSTAGHWSSGAAPAAGNTYDTAGYNLRATDSSSGTITFAGDSLKITAPGYFLQKPGNNTANPPNSVYSANWILNGGSIQPNSGNGSGTLNIAGTVQLIANSVLQTGGSKNMGLTILAPIGESGGSFGLSLTNICTTTYTNSTITLAGANTFSGPTTLLPDASGSYPLTLVLSNALALQNSTLVHSYSYHVVRLAGDTAFTLGGLSGTLASGTPTITLTNQAGSAVALSVGNNNTDTTYAGVLSGTGSLLKVGAGKLTLSGASTYAGDTTISAGTLALSGSGSIGSSTPNITVASGATLDVAGASSTLSLASGQTLNVSSTGANASATNNISATAGVKLSTNGIVFTAYGGANGASATQAPLIVAGAGTLNLNGGPITVSTTTALGVGSYVLIATNGSATLSGSPGFLTLNGSNVVANAVSSVAVTNGQLVLTVAAGGPPAAQLAITSVNGGLNPTSGVPFNVVVQSQDGTGAPRAVATATPVSLTLNTGTGSLGGTLTGTIPANYNTVTISGVTYVTSSAGDTGVVMTVSTNSGTSLAAGTSSPFNVSANTNKSILTFTFPTYGAATISGTNINKILYTGTPITNLAPTYTLSTLATCVPASGSAHDFSSPVSYTVTANDGSTQTYTVTVTLVTLPTLFTWTNAVSGNWSSAANWTNNAADGTAPTAGGLANYTLNFNQAGAYTANNDLNSDFLLNQLNFGGSTVSLAGNSLALTNNGATLPALNQNGAVGIIVNNNLTLGTNTTVGGSGSGTVSLYGAISGAGGLTKANSGQLTFYGTNGYTGGTFLSAGTLYVRADLGATLGASGSVNVTVQSGATLLGEHGNFSGMLILNGGTWSENNGFGGSWTGPVMINTNSTITSAFGQTINGNVSGGGGLTHTGTGTLSLTGTNTFTGPLAVNAGALSAASLNSVSGGAAASNLGTPTTVLNGTISLGATTTTGTLSYTGPGETTDRVIKLAGTTGGATLTQAGTGAGLPLTQAGQSGLLKFTSALSIPGTPGADNRKTLTLTSAETYTGPGYATGQGEISGSIGDSLQGNSGQLATSVTKAGSGTWTLSGSNTYTGTTRVQAGRLVCTRADALGSGPLDITNGTATLELDFVGSRRVASLTLNGVVQPNGTYGSSSSIATLKDDVHFIGPGAVTVGSVANATTNSLALTSGLNPSSGGAALTFTATVTGGNTPAGNVVFYDGLTPLGTNFLNGSFQASLSTSTLTGGVHAIAALYLGNSSNAPSASPALTQTVVDTRPATTTTLALTTGASPSSLGAAVTFTATVAGATPTGTVGFYDGTTLLGAGALNGSGQAAFTTSALTSGWHGILAAYQGDVNNAPSTSAPVWQTVRPPAGNGKLKVFILAGQSNMQGKGQVEQGRDPNNPSGPLITGGLGTLRNMLNSDPNKYGYLVDTNKLTSTTVPGWRTLTNVWVSYFTTGSPTPAMTEVRKGYLDADFGDGSSQGRIGPEYGFGLVVGSQLGDPVLLIKTAWGGTSLTGDWRPPSSGGTVGPCYTTMVAIVHNTLANLSAEFTNFSYSGGGYEIAGFAWHQGWNDIGEPQAQYETNLVNLIHDVRTEFGTPNLPVAIGVTGMGSADLSSSQLAICAAQAAVANPVLHPELAGTVFTVDTRPFDYGLLLGVNNQGFHWYYNGQSQFNIGQAMGLGMMSLLTTPPGVTNIPASGVSSNSAEASVSVTWPYTPCNLTAYWGAANGGTNAALWSNSAPVAAWSNTTATYQYGFPGDRFLAGESWPNVVSTNLSFTLTGLNPNTTYSFTFCATNQAVSDLSVTNAQTIWATNVQKFTTLAVVTPPPVPVLPGGAITVIGGVPSFTFATVSGYKYRLVWKNGLTDPLWQPLIAPGFPSPDGWSSVSTGAPMSLSDTNVAGQAQRFYRLEAANP